MKLILAAALLGVALLTAGCGELGRDLLTIGRCIALDNTRQKCN